MTSSEENVFSDDDYNGTFLSDELYRRYMSYMDMVNERSFFRYFYFVFTVLILVTNILVLVAICASRKQRRHFRNWLIMHMIVIHILFGAIVCPFLGQLLVENYSSLGLTMVMCKLLYFSSDVLSYMSNLSVGVLGVYQTAILCSPRLLNGVSHTLLTAILIVIPWFVVTMLTAVLRLTMSAEYLGDCYKIDDLTAQIVWTVFAYGIPLFIVCLCLVSVIMLLISPFVNTTESSPPGRRNVIAFIVFCLASCLVMRTPFYFVYSEPLSEDCDKNLGIVICQRVKLSFDQLRLLSMVVIPLVYLIPTECRKGFRKMKTSCCQPECSSARKPTVELENVHVNERMIV